MDSAVRQRHRAAYDSITRLCGRAEADGQLFRALARQLRPVVAFRTGGWGRVDPLTLLPMSGLLVEAGHDRMPQLIRHEYLEPDFAKYRDLARQPVPVQTLWQATGGDLGRSFRYRSVLAGLGYGDVLRAVFRCDGTAWGAMYLARSAADPPFSAQDVSFVASVCEPVARGLRTSHLLAGAGPAGPTSPGVLIVGDDGSVASQTAAATHWLARLPPEHARGFILPATVLGAAAAARTGSPAVAHVRAVDGRWLRVHAEHLGGESGQAAVVIEPAPTAELWPLMLDLHGITEREREITQLLLRGLPTAEIARELFISRYTVGDHVKSIFAKLGVSSRPELTALLLETGHPGPAPPGSGRGYGGRVPVTTKAVTQEV